MAQDAVPPTWFDGVVDAWQTLFPGDPSVAPGRLAARLITAFLLGLVVAFIYRSTAAPARRTRSFVATLVLLSILIALVVQVVGSNTARAFTLVGALSIVRFRTVVQDTRDTAFVIFAVIVGMAVGGDHVVMTLIGIAVCGFAAWLLRSRRQKTPHHPAPSEHWMLHIRVAASNAGDGLRDALGRWFPRCELAETATVKKGACLRLRYEVFPRADVSVLDCVAALRALPGVQSVKLDRQ
jgi:hypothetical protein